MVVAIIGAGNVGGALAGAWAGAGHAIRIGARNPGADYVLALAASSERITVHSIPDAVEGADAVLLSMPAQEIRSVLDATGPMDGAIVIDATNAVRAKPEGFDSPYAALRAWAPGAEIVKCFNATGFNVMANPRFGTARADMFMAGHSMRAKEAARRLALDADFGACYDAGGDEAVPLIESLAKLWITLAIMRGEGREIAFTLLRR